MNALLCAVLLLPAIVPLDSKFAKQAASLQQSGADFEVIFRQLCKAALDETGKDPKLRHDDCARSIFGGLWLWLRDGGRASLQGRDDWAQHFVGGGMFEGYWDTGDKAGLRKEKSDSIYDLDDLAATMLGARWMKLATGEKGRQWIELWATGKLTLSRSLPKLNYGRLASGQQATSEQIAAIRAAVDSALTLGD